MQSLLKGINQALLAIFLWPGEFVRRRIGIDVEEDGGIIRSFINMIIWGGVVLILALRFGV